MALPSDLTTITLTGTYITAAGIPMTGTVIIYVGSPVSDSTGKVILAAGQIPCPLTAAGSFSVVLPCTDNANLNPAGFAYQVLEQIPGLGRSYFIQLPHTLGSTADISSLAPVSAPPAASAFASVNTWTAKQVYSGNPPLEITTGAASGDVLTSDASGNATWQAATGGVSLAGDLGGTTGSPQVISTHLSSPLPASQGGTGAASASAGFNALSPMTTLGDTLYGGTSGAGTRLAGNTAGTKNFLTQTGTGTVSAAPAWAALAAADLPAATTTVQGAVILDGTAADIQPAGVAAAGSKGQAADAKHVHPYQPWQFLPESYGAKGDGAFLYDVAISASSATLTTVGLPAPSAPSVSNSGTGGTVLAGVYQVKITYVNAFGETLGSSASTTTTSGSTSSITVTTPGSWTNATGYYVYCTQPGGSTYTRQQSPGSPTQLGVNYVITAPPTGTGAAPPGVNTTASSPFTSGDVGKLIVVPDANGSNLPLCTTIQVFNSAQSVTLAASAASSVTSYGAVYGSDDTTAWQTCINNAVAYAQTSEQGLAEILPGNKIYCIGGAVQTTIGGLNYWYTQLAIPYVPAYVGRKVQLKITGPVEASGPVHWNQPNPQANGAVLACMRGDGAFSGPSNGTSVLGGPITSFGGTFYSNMRLVVDGLNFLVPYGPTYAGLDAYGISQVSIRSIGYFCMARTTVGSAGGWPLYQNGGYGGSWRVFGLRPPAPGNNDQSDIDRLTVYGCWAGFFFGDHTVANSVKVVFCQGAAFPFGGPLGSIHHSFIASLSSEATAYPLYAPNSGQFAMGGGNGIPLVIGIMHLENASALALDPNNVLYGICLGVEQLGGLNLVPTGAANFVFLQSEQALGKVASPPAIPSSAVAYTNTFGQRATVTVTGGTVSAIAIDGAATGLTSGPVPVRNGGTITLTYTVAPAWNWVLG